MSNIVNSKKSIFNRLAAFSSLKEIELKPNNLFTSIESLNNSKDPIPFLLDLSTSLVGSDALENKFGLLVTNFISEFDIKIKEISKKQFTGINSNIQLPNSFIDNGINIPISKLDDLNNIKTSKTDPLGEVLYDNPNNLTSKLKDSIILSGQDVLYGNLVLNYNQNTQSINVKPNNSSGTVGSFLINYINGLNNINKKLIVTDILNSIYGLKNKLQNKTLKEIKNDLEIDFIIDKILNEDIIEFTDDDLKEIENLSEQLFKGFNEIDLGCGFIINEITEEELINTSNIIAGTMNPDLVRSTTIDIFKNSLDSNSNPSNITNLKDSFIKKLINLLKNRIIKEMLFSPDMKLLFYLNQSVQDNQTINFIETNIDYIKNNINIVNCLTTDIKSIIVEFIFNLVKTEILEITKPVIQKIIQEKINNYNTILRSLINI